MTARTKKPIELAQSWDRICYALLAKLEKTSIRISVEDMKNLPHDRVLLSDESPTEVVYKHVKPERAQAMLEKGTDRRGEPVTHTPLMGRWHKMAAVLLWKYFPNGVTLKRAAILELPVDQVLCLEGHEFDIELRFVSRADARAIAAKERFDTGKSVIERIGEGRVEFPQPGGRRQRFGPRRR